MESEKRKCRSFLFPIGSYRYRRSCFSIARVCFIWFRMVWFGLVSFGFILFYSWVREGKGDRGEGEEEGGGIIRGGW